MSILSAQCDELRIMANISELPDGVRLALRQAADTIWQLRDDLQRANADNDRLRQMVRDYDRCTMHADCARCEYDGKLSTHCPLSPCFPDADELRVLGVEVDG